jgi:hypothetical protein
LDIQRRRVDPRYPRLRVERARGRSRRKKALIAILALGLASGVLGGAAIVTNTAGAGVLYQKAIAKVDRFLAGPPPDRSIDPEVLVTPVPATPTPGPSASLPPLASGQPPPSVGPTPTPIPRVAVDVNIVQDPESVFAHEIDKDWCAPAGVTMVIAIMGKHAATDALEREIASRVREWESYKDSHNGDWGPSAMALALDAYGVPGYKVRIYETRADALRGAAKAISTTRSPAILLAWRGAHTWVMSGYRANADPVVFDDAKVSGTYILDPWYPWNSSIWGQSDPPGTFQDSAEMVRNFLPWKRPEGLYPGRDGNFLVVEPTIPRS